VPTTIKDGQECPSYIPASVRKTHDLKRARGQGARILHGQSWTIRIGSVGAIELRLHLITCIFAVISCYFAWSQPSYLSGDFAVPFAIAGAMLVFAIAIHQVGHFVVSRWLGERITSMVIFPFGGQNVFSPQPSVRSLLPIHLAGPLANVLAGSVLLMVGLACQMDLGEFARRPLLPVGLIEGAPWQVALKTGIWLQWMIAMINSLPCGPLDGALALKALAKRRHPQRAHEFEQRWLRWGAFFTACLLTLIAVTRFNSDVYEPIAFWLPLTLTALLLVFSAGMESSAPPSATRREQSHAGYGDGPSSDVEHFADEEMVVGEFASGSFDAGQYNESVDDEIEEDVSRLDRILDKLHRLGKEQLSSEEVAYLEQASERFRQRTD
jgi:Zn-dependent protease